jgi:hypothetical protein
MYQKGLRVRRSRRVESKGRAILDKSETALAAIAPVMQALYGLKVSRNTETFEQQKPYRAMHHAQDDVTPSG